MNVRLDDARTEIVPVSSRVRWLFRVSAVVALCLAAAGFLALPFSNVSAGRNPRHHAAAVALAHVAHEMLFASESTNSAHHEATVKALRALHDLVSGARDGELERSDVAVAAYGRRLTSDCRRPATIA